MNDQQTEQLRTFLAGAKLPLLYRRTQSNGGGDTAINIQIGLNPGNEGEDFYWYNIGATQGISYRVVDMDDFSLTEHGFSFSREWGSDYDPPSHYVVTHTFAEPQTLEEVQTWCAPWLNLPDTAQSLLDFRKWVLATGREGPEYFSFPL